MISVLMSKLLTIAVFQFPAEGAILIHDLSQGVGQLLCIEIIHAPGDTRILPLIFLFLVLNSGAVLKSQLHSHVSKRGLEGCRFPDFLG